MFNLKIISLFFIITLSSNIDVFAQSYQFAYSGKLLLSQEGSTSTETNINFKYIGVANMYYLQVYVIDETKKLDFNTKAELEHGNKMVLDTKNNLAYFPQLKEVQNNKAYKLKRKKGNLYMIEGFGEGYEVILDKQLPRYITPCIAFSNAKYGVKSIKTPDFIMKLVPESVMKTSENLSYRDFFKPYIGKKTTTVFEFIQKK